MKKSNVSILLAFLALAMLALWSRAQTTSQQLKMKVNGVEVHTLMSDQHNALVGHLEATGQTNVLELLRQYRCAYNADLSASKLGDAVTALEHLRAGRTNEAIQLLEQNLGFYAGLMCNSYGCLNSTNREKAKLESLERARAYYAKFPPPQGDTLEKAMNEVLRLSKEKPKKTNASALPSAENTCCVCELEQIEGAKVEWAQMYHKTTNDTPTLTELQPIMFPGRLELKMNLQCPKGGTYKIGRVGERPTCSVGGLQHSLP